MCLGVLKHPALLSLLRASTLKRLKILLVLQLPLTPWRWLKELCAKGFQFCACLDFNRELFQPATRYEYESSWQVAAAAYNISCQLPHWFF